MKNLIAVILQDGQRRHLNVGPVFVPNLCDTVEGIRKVGGFALKVWMRDGSGREYSNLIFIPYEKVDYFFLDEGHYSDTIPSL